MWSLGCLSGGPGRIVVQMPRLGSLQCAQNFGSREIATDLGRPLADWHGASARRSARGSLCERGSGEEHQTFDRKQEDVRAQADRYLGCHRSLLCVTNPLLLVGDSDVDCESRQTATFRVTITSSLFQPSPPATRPSDRPSRDFERQSDDKLQLLADVIEG